MNPRPAPVSFHYITRDKLLPTLREAQEKITQHVLAVLQLPRASLLHSPRCHDNTAIFLS